MAVDITVGDTVYMNAVDYTVTEDSTPTNVDDFSGGVGEITYTYDRTPDDFRHRNKKVTLKDGLHGVVSGLVKSVSRDDFTSTVSAYARTIALSVQRTTKPYRGTLGGALRYYLSLVDLADVDIIIDPTLESRAVVLPGWTDEVYLRVAKHLCAAQQMEMSYVSDKVVFRPLRTRIAERFRDSDVSMSIDESNLAQKVRLNYYNPVWKDRALAYPLGGWNEDVEIFTVDAGETVEFDDVEVSASLESVEQPVCVTNVGPEYSASSVYTVMGSDSLPIPPAQWEAQGGSLRVVVNKDTRSLKIVIRGAREKKYAPYSIAVSSGSGNDYSTLRIVGKGVFLDKQTIEADTGYGPDQATTEIAGDAENEFVGTYDEAQQHLGRALSRYGSPTISVSATTSGINRRGDTGSYAFATIGQFNKEYKGMTIGGFNTLWSGKTIKEFNEFWRNTVLSEFENQSFGNVAGARMREEDKFFRIRSATNKAGIVSYRGDSDTIIRDFNTEWAGKTIGDFNRAWAGKKMADFTLHPLAGATNE